MKPFGIYGEWVIKYERKTKKNIYIGKGLDVYDVSLNRIMQDRGQYQPLFLNPLVRVFFTNIRCLGFYQKA
jgi:hypothetical protein